MIFTYIYTRKNTPNSTGKSSSAKVIKPKVEVSKSDLVISGEGQHQKEDVQRNDSWSTKSENLDNPDYIDEFRIELDKESVISICQAALKRKLIQISDIIPQELEAEICKVQDDLNNLLNKITGL